VQIWKELSSKNCWSPPIWRVWFSFLANYLSLNIYTLMTFLVIFHFENKVNPYYKTYHMLFFLPFFLLVRFQTTRNLPIKHNLLFHKYLQKLRKYSFLTMMIYMFITETCVKWNCWSLVELAVVITASSIIVCTQEEQGWLLAKKKISQKFINKNCLEK